MPSNKLERLLEQARRKHASTSGMEEPGRPEERSQWQKRADILKTRVLPRLVAAKEACKPRAELTIHDQTTYSTLAPDRAPSISFEIRSTSRPNRDASPSYSFAVDETGAVRVFEVTGVSREVTHDVGLVGSDIDNGVIDNVLELAARSLVRPR